MFGEANGLSMLLLKDCCVREDATPLRPFQIQWAAVTSNLELAVIPDSAAATLMTGLRVNLNTLQNQLFIPTYSIHLTIINLFIMAGVDSKFWKGFRIIPP